MLAYLSDMKPTPNILVALLESFSRCRIDDEIDTVNVTIEKAGTFWAAADMADCERDVDENTSVVRLETDDDGFGNTDDYHFRMEDLLGGEVKDGSELTALDTDGVERKLVFFVEVPSSLV